MRRLIAGHCTRMEGSVRKAIYCSLDCRALRRLSFCTCPWRIPFLSWRSVGRCRAAPTRDGVPAGWPRHGLILTDGIVIDERSHEGTRPQVVVASGDATAVD